MAKFIERTTAPTTTDPNWIQRSFGGKNAAILINPSNGSVLSNCVGYVHGRWLELLGVHSYLSLNNASTFYGRTSDGYARGAKPKVGAVACWGGGYLDRGHVAVVERVNGDGTYIVSYSDYGGTRFVRVKIGANNYLAKGLFFQGFIYIPKTYTNEPLLSFDQVVENTMAGEYGNMPGRKTLVESTGHNYDAVQAEVNKRINQPVTPSISREQVILNTINGDYGNYPGRKTKIEELGFDYNDIQSEVNIRVSGTTNLDKVAREVWLGNYGNGEARRTKLRNEGYDPDKVQARVNELYYS